ncbi:MAG: hypothetical protein ABW352_03750 [Polyangiales bacterium]
MRSLLLLCALAVSLILVCKPSKRHAEEPSTPVSVAVAAEVRLVPEVTTAAAKPSLLSLLTLGTAVLGAVATNAAESPFDANAQLAVRIVDATAELEASAARVADQRAR